MNLCPCGARGDPGAECSCSAQRLASFRDKLSRALLDRFDLVVTVPRPRAEELAAGPAEASAPVAERVDVGAGAARVHRPRRTRRGRRAALDRRSSGCRSRAAAGRASPASLGPPRRSRPEPTSCPEHVAEALGYRSPRELEACMSELALAAFAAETGDHVIREPKDARFRHFAERFDERAYTRGLAAAGIRWLARSDPAFPGSLASIFDPPAGLFVRGDGAARAARAARRRRRRRAGLLLLRLARRPHVRPRARRRRAPGRQRDGARRRRRGASRRARGGRSDGRVLGCGVDRDYPAAHAELARRIARPGSSSPSTHRASSRRHGAFRRATVSSRGCAR